MNFLKKILFIVTFIFGLTTSLAQQLPIHFEKQEQLIRFTGGTNDQDKSGFDGGAGEIANNPDVSEANMSPKVGKIVRDGGTTWAGSRIPVERAFNFTNFDVVQFKIFTSAPAGIEVLLKLEDIDYANNGYAIQTSVFTTKSNEWETLQFTYNRSTTSFDHLVFMFDFGNVGNGSANSTFYFDNIIQTSLSALAADTLDPYIDFGEEYKTNEELSIENEDKSTFKVYPNPSTSFWNFESDAVITQVEIIDLQGKKVISLSPNQNSARISTDFLANGLYLSEITTHSGVKRVKLIKH
jgi:hypothetical protein